LTDEALNGGAAVLAETRHRLAGCPVDQLRLVDLGPLSHRFLACLPRYDRSRTVASAGRLDHCRRQDQNGARPGAFMALSEEALKIVAEIPPGLPPIGADQRALKQILLNLLSNAVKFTPAGGQITLRAGLEPKGGVAFRVRDTGTRAVPDVDRPLSIGRRQRT